jgi:hypothetical protein
MFRGEQGNKVGGPRRWVFRENRTGVALLFGRDPYSNKLHRRGETPSRDDAPTLAELETQIS